MTKRTDRSAAKKPADASSPAPPVVWGEMGIACIQALNDLAMELKSRQHIGTKLRQAMGKTRDLIGADMVFFCSVDQSAGGYYAKAVFPDTDRGTMLEGLPVPAPPPRISSETGAGGCIPLHFDKSTPDASLFIDRIRQMGIVTGMAMPLQVNDHPLGFLFAGNREASTFTNAQQCLLSLIGNLVAAEIDRGDSKKERGRLATILEQAAETIMITDREGFIQYVNPAFELISGYSRQEVIGRRPSILHSGRQSQDFYRQMKKTIQAGKVWRGQLVNRRKDGAFYELDATISPIKNDRGEITDYISVRKDITQESILRTQLYQAQKMEAIGTLAGGIAHDFNNLLMGIQGNVSLMRMEMPRDHAHQGRCKAIETYIRKGADLTRQLLGVARNNKFQKVPTDISKLAEASLEMFGRAKKEIRTHMDPDSRSCVAEVDPGQIDQVLLNLLVNAWQAMPQGGDLYMETRALPGVETLSEIGPLKPGPCVSVTIRDTGTGIDDAILDKIFDPFFTTKEKGRGTGLGLASAYGIVKNHGGIIQVRSQRGRGTTFEILLPASHQHSTEIERPEGHVARGRETLLLVDDESMVLEICGEMLRSLGYRIITASTGKDALSIFKARKDDIDLVILDLIMPGMGGEAVFDALMDINPLVRVLIASGYALEGKKREQFTRHHAGFIQKPFSVTSMSQKVRQMIDQPVKQIAP